MSKKQKLPQTFLRRHNGWHVIGDVLFSFLGIFTSRLRKLKNVVLANRKRRDLMWESDGFNIVDVVF